MIRLAGVQGGLEFNFDKHHPIKDVAPKTRHLRGERNLTNITRYHEHDRPDKSETCVKGGVPRLRHHQEILHRIRLAVAAARQLTNMHPGCLPK